MAINEDKVRKLSFELKNIYWDVDDETLYRILQTNLVDLDRFLRELGEFLNMHHDI